MISATNGAILLATYEARSTIDLWKKHRVSETQIALLTGWEPCWGAIERHIVAVRIGLERMPLGARSSVVERAAHNGLVVGSMPAAPIVQPLKVGPLPGRLRLAA